MRSYGRAGEDMFPLAILKNDTSMSRTYIEVDPSDPVMGNATFLLEKSGWYGVTVGSFEGNAVR